MLRVSTSKQDNDPQKDELVAYAEQRGYNKLHIIETKESGLASLKNRAGLDELIQFVKNNEDYKSLFITEISRIGRRQSVIHEVREYLMENNFKLYIKDLNLVIDNNSDNFNFLFNIYASYAESEVKSKKERFSRAKSTYKKLGYFMGGKRLFGYEIEQIENSKRKIYTLHQKTHRVSVYGDKNRFVQFYEKRIC
jgi:DNA invertase Pin-like site-specific DNA recombinase